MQSNDLQSGYEKLNDFEKEHNISLSERNRLETDIINEFTNTSELKGFTNGFKFALRMLSEVNRTE